MSSPSASPSAAQAAAGATRAILNPGDSLIGDFHPDSEKVIKVIEEDVNNFETKLAATVTGLLKRVATAEEERDIARSAFSDVLKLVNQAEVARAAHVGVPLAHQTPEEACLGEILHEGKICDVTEDGTRFLRFVHPVYPIFKMEIPKEIWLIPGLIFAAIQHEHADKLKARIEAHGVVAGVASQTEASAGLAREQALVAEYTLYGQYRYAQLETIQHFEEEVGKEAFEAFKRDLGNTPLEVAFKKLIESLYSPNIESSVRVQRDAFIEQLRSSLKMLETSASHPKCADIKRYVQAICYVRFAKVNLTPYYSQVIPIVAKEGGAELLKPQTIAELSQAISESSKWLTPQDGHGKSWLESYEERLNTNFGPGDSTAKDNVPHVRSTNRYVAADGSIKLITYQRHGAPTMMNGAKYERCPEYVAYVEYAESKVENILEVVFEGQDLMEMERVNARLDVKENNYFALRLPLDGEFFNGTVQTGGLREMLVDSFFDEATAKKTGIMVPEKVREKLSKERLLTIFKEASQIVEAAQGLTVSEKHQATIMWFYTILTHHLQFVCGASHVKTPCKDDSDRGNVMKVMGEVYRAILLGKENVPELLKGIYMQGMMASFHVKRKGMSSGRLPLLQTALKCVTQISDELREVLRGSEIHQGHTLNEMTFPSQERQEGIPTIETVYSFREYDAVFAQFMVEGAALIGGSDIEAYLKSRLESQILGIEVSLFQNVSGSQSYILQIEQKKKKIIYQIPLLVDAFQGYTHISWGNGSEKRVLFHAVPGWDRLANVAYRGGVALRAVANAVAGLATRLIP